MTNSYGLVIIKNGIIFDTQINNNLVSFLFKNSFIEGLNAIAKILFEKINVGKTSINLYEEKNTIPELAQCFAHCIKYNPEDGIIFFVNKDYKPRIAYTFMIKIFELNDKSKIKSMFIESDDPNVIDNISKINKDLEDLKIKMYENIDQILKRGENIDSLLLKSAELSENSKRFYIATKKTNSCCVIS
jgi:hypothetical protein